MKTCMGVPSGARFWKLSIVDYWNNYIMDRYWNIEYLLGVGTSLIWDEN